MPFKEEIIMQEAFSIWMAGGGIKGGTSYGETDEIGYSAVSGKSRCIRYSGNYFKSTGL